MSRYTRLISHRLEGITNDYLWWSLGWTGGPVAALRQKGIGVNVHYIPVHTQPYYRAMGFAEGDYPEAERYYREAISLPLFPGLAEDEQAGVVSALRETL